MHRRGAHAVIPPCGPASNWSPGIRRAARARLRCTIRGGAGQGDAVGAELHAAKPVWKVVSDGLLATHAHALGPDRPARNAFPRRQRASWRHHHRQRADESPVHGWPDDGRRDRQTARAMGTVASTLRGPRWARDSRGGSDGQEAMRDVALRFEAPVAAAGETVDPLGDGSRATHHATAVIRLFRGCRGTTGRQGRRDRRAPTCRGTGAVPTPGHRASGRPRTAGM
jgi:hypothetical protein